jgi:7-cyano-7-deazaguanine synthase
MENKYAVLSLSGGMDSSTLLLHLLKEGYQTTCLSFDYGQKHKVELDRAEDLISYISLELLKQGKIQKPLKHRIIKLEGLSDLLNSTLVTGGGEVPEGHYEKENMKDTVVPNRNKIFSSIIQAVALSIATTKNSDCIIAMGIHAGDHQIYPDCRKEFRDADFEAFKLGNWDSEKVSIYTPYLNINKFEILQDGSSCCEILGLNFNEVYKRTNTSYKPIQIGDKWYSDYKSGSSVERIEAFIKLGLPDPVDYADENGFTSWEVVKSHVENILKERNENL